MHYDDIAIKHRLSSNSRDVLACNSVKGSNFILNIGTEISPEFYKEESILRTLVVEFLESALLFWEFVVNLTDINRLRKLEKVALVNIHCK